MTAVVVSVPDVVLPVFQVTKKVLVLAVCLALPPEIALWLHPVKSRAPVAELRVSVPSDLLAL